MQLCTVLSEIICYTFNRMQKLFTMEGWQCRKQTKKPNIMHSNGRMEKVWLAFYMPSNAGFWVMLVFFLQQKGLQLHIRSIIQINRPVIKHGEMCSNFMSCFRILTIRLSLILQFDRWYAWRPNEQYINLGKTKFSRHVVMSLTSSFQKDLLFMR